MAKTRRAAVRRPPSVVSVPVLDRSLGSLAYQRSHRLREVFSIMKQKHPARAPLHKEGDQRSVSLGRVAVPASEHQVVRTIVCRLTPAGPDVVQGYGVFAGFGAAICANRPVLSQQPIAVRLHGTTRGTTETRDGNCGMSSRSACHKEPS